MRLIVEADGGSRGNPGRAGGGAVVFDGETGRVLDEVGVFLGEATNNVAEYTGLIGGLRAAMKRDPERIDVRMDSKLVVEQLAGRWKIKHLDMQALAATARTCIGAIPITFTWVPRAQNAAADRLANEAMDTGTNFIRSADLRAGTDAADGVEH